MDQRPLHQSRLRRIVVVRALPGLGDMLCLVPAVRALRAAKPELHIALVGLPSARPLAARFPGYFDEFLEFPGYPGIAERPEPAEGYEAWVASVARRRFDVAVQAHGDGSSSNRFVRSLGARSVLAYHPTGTLPPDDGVYLPWVEAEHEAERLLRLLRPLGIDADDARLEFPVTAEDEADCARLVRTAALKPGGYAIVHPGATRLEQRWDAKGFAAVADALAEAGVPVVMTGSTAEKSITARVAATMRAPALDLTGRTTIGSLAALTRGARIVVCNDTGVSHLAVALGTPSVVLFTSTDPARWAPTDRETHRYVRVGAQPDVTPTVIEHVRGLLDKAACDVA